MKMYIQIQRICRYIYTKMYLKFDKTYQKKNIK